FTRELLYLTELYILVLFSIVSGVGGDKNAVLYANGDEFDLLLLFQFSVLEWYYSD
ncbi:hypothetical protein L9F63_020887, partial [Diploptera punctata]